jgi:hypothetical protein
MLHASALSHFTEVFARFPDSSNIRIIMGIPEQTTLFEIRRAPHCNPVEGVSG